jgi:hypothetical protein
MAPDERSISLIAEMRYLMRRISWIDILNGAAAICLGGWAAFAHWLAYYRYPFMRCSSVFTIKER